MVYHTRQYIISRSGLRVDLTSNAIFSDRLRREHRITADQGLSTFAFMKFLEYVVIFGMGAMTYYFIELLWRGYSHWTMAVVGGAALIIIGLLNEGLLPAKFGILPQALVGSIIITMVELIVGIILNIWLHLGIWDYSHMWGNFLGQICPLFSFFWVLLSIVAIFVDDLMRHWFFGEPTPTYAIWMRKDI